MVSVKGHYAFSQGIVFDFSSLYNAHCVSIYIIYSQIEGEGAVFLCQMFNFHDFRCETTYFREDSLAWVLTNHTVKVIAKQIAKQICYLLSFSSCIA